MNKVVEYLSPYWTKLDVYVQHNTGRVTVAALSCIFIFWSVVLLAQMIRQARRKYKGKGKRMQELKPIKARILADAITETIEDMVYKQMLTRKNARYVYRRLGKNVGLKDLFPRKSAKTLKKEIKARLGLKDGDPIPKKKSQSKPVVEDKGATLEVVSAV